MLSNKSKKEKEIVNNIEDLINKYNNSICYLKKHDTFNKDINAYVFIDKSNVSYYIKMLRTLISKSIKINQLHKIVMFMKQVKNSDYILENLWKNPEVFINEEHCLITYNQLLKISSTFNIKISSEVLIEKWMFNMFNKNDSIYIKHTDFVNEINESNSNNILPNINRDVQKQMIMKIKKEICVKETFDNELYYTSKYLDKLQKMLGTSIKKLYYDSSNNCQKTDNISREIIDLHIETFEKDNIATIVNGFDTKQKEAIFNIINNKLSILTGYPGTGKSEILNCVCQYLENNFNNISLGAPTGLATNNLIERCIFKKKENKINSNLFRLLYVTYPKILSSLQIKDEVRIKTLKEKYDKLKYETNEIDSSKLITEITDLEYYKYKPEVIIVDESSMINLNLFNKLISYCIYFDCKLILAGDQNQLPPIGGGFPFYDLINCKLFGVDKLTDIYRNKGCLSSNIIKMNSQTIFKSDFTDKTIEFINIENFIKNNELNIHNISTIIKFNNFTKDNCKFITPQNNHLFGKNNLNIILQRIFNSKNIPISNPISYNNYINYREHDYIIRTINSHNEDKCMANGDTCKILNVIYEPNKLERVNIKYCKDDNVIDISLLDLHEEFDLSYCLSVHKAQGHGFDNIVLFISKMHNYMWTNESSKKLLYTAISRAKNKCIIIGDYDLFIKSQKNSKNKNNVYPSIFMKKFY